MPGLETAMALVGLIPAIKNLIKTINDLKKAPLDADAKQAVKDMVEEITKSSKTIVKATTRFTGLLATDPNFFKDFMGLYAEFNDAKAGNQNAVRTHCEAVTKHLNRLVGYDEQKDKGTSTWDKIKTFGDKLKLNKDAIRRLRDIENEFRHTDDSLESEMVKYLENTYNTLTSIRNDISASGSASDADDAEEHGYDARKKFDDYTSTIMPNLNALSGLLSDVEITLKSL